MDSRCLPLTNNHIDLYKVIHRHYLRELGKFPNIIKCRDYNDKIQWLKLFDQDWSIVSCTDKLSVRDYVKNRVGAEYLIDVYEVREKFSEIDFDALPSSFVIKANHDSGTSILVRDKADFDRVAAESHFDQVLNRVYGRGMGEWSYAYIRPRIFVEEFLGPEATSPPADYKFHCLDGAVRFLQYIYERGTNTKEVIVDSNGCETTMRLDLRFEKGYRYEKPANWSDMISVAEKLAAGFKYVRVDLYLVAGKIYAGEMTFWPMAGCYHGNGQRVLGVYLDFGRTTFKKPITANAFEVGC